MWLTRTQISHGNLLSGINVQTGLANVYNYHIYSPISRKIYDEILPVKLAGEL